MSPPARPTTLDLNADVGEAYGRWSLGDDDALLAAVSSANVACGFHAGDPLTLARTLRNAFARGVTVGAHPSYPDLRGFGRRRLPMPPEELRADLLYQLGALEGLARAEGGRVRFVKPHGALYHAMNEDDAIARTVLDAVATALPDAPILVAAGSNAHRLAERWQRPLAREAFADRAYQPDGTLVPRTEEGAVLPEPEAWAARAVELATRGRIRARDGSALELRADSLCLHGDTPGAAAGARRVRAALERAGVRVAPFVPVA